MEKKVFVVVHEGEPCFSTEEDNAPFAIFGEEYDGEVSAKVLAREIGDGAKAVEGTLTY